MPANPTLLRDHVDFLCSLDPERSSRHPESLATVCKYIRQHATQAGMRVRDQAWVARGTEYTNVIAAYLPQQPRRLVICAHYDVVEGTPGADDNASAVAGLLELLRLVDEQQPALDYGIDFVAWCLEEPPYFGSELMGSYVHAKSLADSNTAVLGNICLEMIGYFSDEPGSQRYPDTALAENLPDVGNFIVVVGIDQHPAFNERVSSLMQQDAAIHFQPVTFSGIVNEAARSDHINYQKFGFPAVMVNDTSHLRNPHYHQASDTPDTLDYGRMAAVVDGVLRAAVGM